VSSRVIQFTFKISVSDPESPIQAKLPNQFQTIETRIARASTDKPSVSCETRLEQTRTLFNLTKPLSYPHSSLDDTQDYSPVLYSSTAHASIYCRMLSHLRCTLGHDRKGSLCNTHSELHERWKSYTLQMMDNARQGMGSGLQNEIMF